MKFNRLAGVLAICLLTAAASLRAADADAPLFRIFLKDGSTLVSYGEPARLDDRVVFSMPTSASPENLDLHLVTIPSDRVDWDRTTGYADAARATRYVATRAESDYAMLTTEIAQALNDIALTDKPIERLTIVEKARKTLADWPAAHFNYKQDEIRQMLATLDEAIADLRAASGLGQFDLTFVAASPAMQHTEPLLPPPTPREAIEQVLRAARLTTSAPERTSLLAVALHSLDANASVLPAEWSVSTRIDTKAALAREMAVEESYRTFSARMQDRAAARARAADVRGITRLLDEITQADAALGHARPDVVAALVDGVQEQLDAARRLRLARDRWALRMPAFERYRDAVASALNRLSALRPPLEDIKLLAGSQPGVLAAIQKTAQQVARNIAIISPPAELLETHALLASAAQLASSAATIREEATLAGDLTRAWDASSAAAGALMLTARARSDIQAVFRRPQLPQVAQRPR